jgi:hypothetical protein
MKVVGILRGFPGLGRVVAGIEVLKQFQLKTNAKVKIFTYLQGFEYCKNIFNTSDIFLNNDISSIGIIPVSKSGEMIIDEIEIFDPDLILIDGEPLLLATIKLRFPKLKILTLLNPFDINNPYNKLSSQLFFKDCYAKADYAVVHGLWKVRKPTEFYNKYISINTILRTDVVDININSNRNSNRIVCILGGGSVNGSEAFFENTLKIANNAILIAKYYSDYKMDIFCSSDKIYNHLIKSIFGTENIILHKRLKSPNQLYQNTKLVIARAGRNTISELLYQKIPSLLFATSCNFRGSEQFANLEKVQQLTNSLIIGIDIQSEEQKILESFDFLIKNKPEKDFSWNCGNQEIEKFILDHYAL